METQELPVVSVVVPNGSLHDKDYRSDVNIDLAELTSVPFSWPLAGFESIQELLLEHGIRLPDVDIGFESSNQLVFNVDIPKPDIFLYVCYTPDEVGQIEFHAEIVDDDELQELIEEINEDDLEEE